MSSRRIIIDGSLGEGGGQILRNAISYAAILNQPIEINNIRSTRPKPGLKAQHLTGLRICSEIGRGSLHGDALRSTSIRYTPQQGRHPTVARGEEVEDDDKAGKTYTHVTGDTGTAGSICLLLQAALPCALLSASTPLAIELRGGTNADLAPQYDYFHNIFLPIAGKNFGFIPSIDGIDVIKRGYFPRGGGVVKIETTPLRHGPLRAISLMDRGDVCEITIRAFYAGKVKKKTAISMADAANTLIRRELSLNCEISIICEKNALGSGAGILIWAKTTTGCILGGSGLGRAKKSPEVTGVEAAKELLTSLSNGGCVDDWLQDQLILYMALAEGESEILTGNLTLHTRTAIMIAEIMCAGVKFEVKRVEDAGEGNKDMEVTKSDAYGENGCVNGKHIIRCKGLGFINSNSQQE